VKPQTDVPYDSGIAATEKPRVHPGLGILGYLADLSAGRFILWCYFVYWLVIVVNYFDPDPQIWFTSLGLSLIIGFALYVNTTRSGPSRVRLGRWPTFRLFLTPFCVSSFAALVKGQRPPFVLIFSPRLWDVSLAVAIFIGLGVAVWWARRLRLRDRHIATLPRPSDQSSADEIESING
jgi:hypothetical protein